MNVSVTADMLQSTGGSVNPAAYENYLTALGYMQRYDKPGNLDLAIQALQESVKTDPRFALGYAQLGEAYRMKNRLDHNPNWLGEALANCKKAAEIDNRIPAVHVTLARIHDLMGHHDLALQEFQRALDINPRDATALEGLAHSYEESGRIADAEARLPEASRDCVLIPGTATTNSATFTSAKVSFRRPSSNISMPCSSLPTMPRSI